MVCQKNDFLAPSQKQSAKLGMSAMATRLRTPKSIGFQLPKNKKQPISISFQCGSSGTKPFSNEFKCPPAFESNSMLSWVSVSTKVFSWKVGTCAKAKPCQNKINKDPPKYCVNGLNTWKTCGFRPWRLINHRNDKNDNRLTIYSLLQGVFFPQVLPAIAGPSTLL